MGGKRLLFPTRKIAYVFRENRKRLIEKAVVLIKYIRDVLASRGGNEQLQRWQHLPTIPTETHRASAGLTGRPDTAPAPVRWSDQLPPVTAFSLPHVPSPAAHPSFLCSLSLAERTVFNPGPRRPWELFLHYSHSTSPCCSMGRQSNTITAGVALGEDKHHAPTMHPVLGRWGKAPIT